MNELFSWPFFWSIVAICITVHSIVQSKIKADLTKELMKSGKEEWLDFVEHL